MRTSNVTNVHRPWDGETKPLGQVLAFVSGKGGTGKTVISAATAYALLKSEMRVVAIDADFSTRGLSLYLLGDITRSHELHIRPKNCLADAFMGRMPPEEVEPVSIVRDGVTYDVVLSNSDLWRGGVPDERFLGAATGGPAELASSEYFTFLDALCNRLRETYDYVLLDTRGGFDFTSAVPAVVADGYVPVIEADKVTLEQVAGLVNRIEAFRDTLASGGASVRRPALKGFIINKAAFDVSDTSLPNYLERLHGGKTFGVIPLDRSTVRAYQRADIPVEKFPGSDFSLHLMRTLDHLAAPHLNWPEPNRVAYQRLRSRVAAAWDAERRVRLVQEAIPFGLFATVVLAAVFYLLFRGGLTPLALPAFYVALALFVLAAVLGSMIQTVDILRRRELVPRRLAVAAGAFGLFWAGLAYLAVADVPRTFSQDLLLQSVQRQGREITTLRDSLASARVQQSSMLTQFILLESDTASAASTIRDLERRNAELLEELRAETQRRAALTRQQATMPEPTLSPAQLREAAARLDRARDYLAAAAGTRYLFPADVEGNLNRARSELEALRELLRPSPAMR
jgi:MinD-like ATPase involved in chromosome partitioning or flagellar assembly